MISRLMVLHTPEALFQALPTSLGFSEAEGDYYIRRSRMGALDEEELQRVRDAMEAGLQRLVFMRCWGCA